MIVAPINLISTDEQGTAYITGTKMKVRQIVLEKNAWGLTPEEIQQGHDHLSLAQIYAALAYYYDHAHSIDAEIAAAKQVVDRLRVEQPNPRNRATFGQRRAGNP